MTIYVVYAGKVAVGRSTNLRKAKDIGHKTGADEIRMLHIPDVKDDLLLSVVDKWKRHSWSSLFVRQG